MAKPEVKFEAPVGQILIRAYREEANLFDREGKEKQARRLRSLADRMQTAVDAAKQQTK